MASSTILLSGPVPAADRGLLCEAAQWLGMTIVDSGLPDAATIRYGSSAGDVVGGLCFSTEPEETELPLPQPLTPDAVVLIMRYIVADRRQRVEIRSVAADVVKYRRQRAQFLRISTALSMQNSLEEVLDTILLECRRLLNADAGSVYIREQDRPGRGFADRLRFKVSHNDSVTIGPASEYSIDIDSNRIAGYVALTGKSLSISDVYNLPPGVPYSFSKDFDLRFGYRMKSMLTVPLTNLDGVVVGVLQLMNKKSDVGRIGSDGKPLPEKVIDFSWTDNEIVDSISSIAAVTIERAILYENIQHIFEGFLGSSAAAIDERDRVTSGHSRRVMEYALAFADAINAKNGGPFGVRFDHKRLRQFKFAALLHDIGKIGVPEGVLTKDTRVSSVALEAIALRFELLCRTMREKVSGTGAWFSESEIPEIVDRLTRINRAAGLSSDDTEFLTRIHGLRYVDHAGNACPVLNDSEFVSLCVARGNLTDHERDLINSHAAATARILSQIPWTHDLAAIPDIAAHHHERMDGTGYPDGLFGSAISLESRILSVVDIYDALVAQDRPYKPALPAERALAILSEEAACGHLDAAVVSFFTSEGIWRRLETSGTSV